MIQLLGTFFIISLSGALSPGPLTATAIVEGGRRGKWSGIRLALGHALVEGPYMLLIALALWLGREILLGQPLVAGLIAIVGGGFLIWMGWSTALGAWRDRLSLDGQAAVEPRLGLVPTGALVTLSNPYWWLWWALITPLYIEQTFVWGLLAVLLLFFVHWLADLGWLTGISWLTGSGRGLISPRVYRWVMIVSGALLLFFGLTFVIAGLRFLTTGEVAFAAIEPAIASLIHL
jgi:threonine/homoserine/homoserine lactone efflux protein